MIPIIEVKDLTYTYGGNTPFVNDAVHGVSFAVQPGEIIGIAGHTGSGKSTLVQQLNGLLKPTTGSVLFKGKNIWENPKEIKRIRSEIGLVFQYPEYQLFEETVFADIAFGPKNMGLRDTELDARVRGICELVGIKPEYYDTSPFELSGGEKRRVAIAGVMAMQPQVIIFDEPIAGLDPRGRTDVLKMIEDYRAAFGATILIISHNMEDMALITDRLMIMNDGELLAFDKTEKIFSKQELLHSAGLEVPMVTRVFKQLEQSGYKVPTDIFTVEQAVNYLCEKAGESRD